MAKWRAIHADISTSGQVNRLTEFEQLLFTWMIPHADDWGVLTGNLLELKLKVMPGTDRQSQELDDALRQIEEVGLIWRYEPNGEGPLIQFRKWDDHQPIRKDRRQDPEHTLYPDFCQLPTNAGQSQAVTGHTILDNTIPDKTKVPAKAGKRDPRLDHWAINCYKHTARLHIEIALRDDWIQFAEEEYHQPDDEQKFAALETDFKQFMAKGWNKRNVAWFMEWVRDGKPEKWIGGKSEKDKRGHKRDTETLPYDDFAAAQQEATRLHAGEVGDGGSGGE